MYYNTIEKSVKIREQMVSFLNRFNWDWFTTLTFKDLPGTYAANNRVKKWISLLEKKEKRKVGYYKVLEFTRQGAVHFHLLMGNLRGVRRDKSWQLWFDKNGAARILPFEKKRGVGYYLTKYVIKDEYSNTDSWEIKNLELLRQGDLTIN